MIETSKYRVTNEPIIKYLALVFFIISDYFSQDLIFQYQFEIDALRQAFFYQ
jgi:hypothetical protein